MRRRPAKAEEKRARYGNSTALCKYASLLRVVQVLTLLQHGSPPQAPCTSISRVSNLVQALHHKSARHDSGRTLSKWLLSPSLSQCPTRTVACLSCYPCRTRQVAAAAAEFSPDTRSIRNPASQAHMHCGLVHFRCSSDRQS